MGGQTRPFTYCKLHEFGKSHITQQSIRSNFWFGRVPVRVVSDRSVRYNGRHPRLHLLTPGARGFSWAVSGFGQVSGPEAFSTGHSIKKVTCAKKSGPREKPLDQSAIPLIAPSQLPDRLYQNIQKLDVYWLVPWRCRMLQMLWLDYSHNRRVIGTQVVWRWQRSDPNNPSTHQVRLPYHFHRYGGHIEFIRELWHAQGALAIAQYLRELFGQKENFTIYFSGKRWSLLHPNTAQLTIFFLHYNLFLGKISIGNSMNCSAFGINNTSDISKLFYKIEIWDNFEISRVVFMPNIMYKSCYYLFILLPAKGL